MTDNEIIKIFTVCITSEDCSICPMFRNCPTSFAVQKAALDLINRQKAEIERLEKTVENMTEGCQIAIKVSENEAIRRFSYRLRAECGSYDTGHYIFHEDEIHNLVKEMVGEG